MRSKQLIATLPKAVKRITPVQAVKIADATAPIREVEVVLGSALSQRFLACGGRQPPRSTAWAAASRSGAGIEAGEGEPLSVGAAPCESFPIVPLVGETEPRRRPRRRRNFRGGGATPFSVGGAPPSGAGTPLAATATPGVTGRGPYPRRRRRDRPPPAGAAPTRCRRRSPRWRPPTAASIACSAPMPATRPSRSMCSNNGR